LLSKKRKKLVNDRRVPRNVKIVAQIDKQNMCTGCGVCAAICPTNSIKMGLNRYGEFVPFVGEDCRGCEFCKNFCIQLSKEKKDFKESNFSPKDNDEIFGSSEAFETWSGYALNPNRRLKSASGGILTLVLQNLLTSQLIDAAIVVGSRNHKSDPFFYAKIVRTHEELDACSGSKYYPIEFSKVLQEIQITNENVAIVGLPCHINAIRVLTEKFKKQRAQIKYLFGLICGHGSTTQFTEFLIASSKAPYDKVDEISYREKKLNLEASNYTFSAFHNNKIIGVPISFEDSPYGFAWANRLFVPYACDFCTDCFAEKADASFMDAWLPEYIKDSRGTSLIISRDFRVSKILRKLTSENLANLWMISPDDIIKSQIGLIRYKRKLLPARVFYAVSHGRKVPDYLKCFAKRGTRSEIRENRRYERNRNFSRFIWKLNLPVGIRVKLILLFCGNGKFLKAKSRIKKIFQKVCHFVSTKNDTEK